MKKHTIDILFGTVIIAGCTLAWSGCVASADVVEPAGYGGVWFHDDAWVDGGGRGWYGGHDDRGYVHPSGGIHVDAHASGGGGHAEAHPSGGGDHDHR